MNQLFKLIAVVLAISASLCANGAVCVSCQQRIAGEPALVTSRTLQQAQPLCRPCFSAPRCWLCAVPDPFGKKLEDGRYLCARDYKLGIFDEAGLMKVFDEVRIDLGEIFRKYSKAPVASGASITPKLVDGYELQRIIEQTRCGHRAGENMGMTASRALGPDAYEHTMYLLNGLGPSRLRAVCAHEFVHVWMNEKVPASRGLSPPAVEGFCDAVAFWLAGQKNEKADQDIIMDGSLWKNQIKAFSDVINARGLSNVIAWIESGSGEVLPGLNAEPTNDPTRSQIWIPPPSAVPTPVPGTLLLRGISGTGRRRFALINDTTLAVGEEGRVRVGTSSVVLRCQEIRQRSAIVRLKGASETVELFLGEQ